MPTINPASDVTARKRYCLTTGQGSSNCCSGPAGTSGPAGPAGPSGPPGPPGSEEMPGALWNIIYSDGASGASASPFLTYDILNDRLGVGQGVVGIAKVQASTSQIAIGNGAGAQQSTSGVIAIGNNAGYSQSGLEAIAIGYNAGYFQSFNADRSIAIGAYAGQSQTASSIILNAAGAIGATSDGGRAGFFVNPIRAVNTTLLNPICYDISSSEVVYNTYESTLPVFKGYVSGVFEATSDFVITTNVSFITYNSIGVSTGGLALGSPSTQIVLPVVGIYEIISSLQCSTSGVVPTSVSAWHIRNGSTLTAARTVTVTSGENSILTVTSMVQTAAITDYVELQVYSPGASGATVDTFTVGSTPNPTNSAVVTTVKLVG